MTDTQKITVGTRLVSMVLDYFLMTLVWIVCAIPLIIVAIYEAINISHTPVNITKVGGVFFYIVIAGFAVYLCKDSINGRSAAKRILKLQVVDNTTGVAASPMQCMVRNLLIVLWPVEVIVTFFNPTRRIGDQLAGTRVAFYDPEQVQHKASITKLIVPFIILFVVFAIPLQFILPEFSNTVDYVESSYNETDSKKLQLLLTDSLSQYLAPDVAVYDSVVGHSMKYVSVIYRLKDDFMDNDDVMNTVKGITNRQLYSMYSKPEFTGVVTYTFKYETAVSTTMMPIGTKLDD